MKIFNILKKKSKSHVISSNVQKLEKTQLEKVIGGGDAPTLLAHELAHVCQQKN